MLVLDASAAAELLVGERGRLVAESVGTRELLAPQLLAVEVLSVLRKWTLSGQLTPERARTALVHLNELDITWYDVPPLMLLAWERHRNVSAYDATYIALAETVGCQVITCDARLARAVPEQTLLVE